VTFQRPSNALPTPLPTLFQRASHSHLFLANGFQLPAPTHPTPLYARALPLGRDARASARRGDSHVLAGNGERPRSVCGETEIPKGVFILSTTAATKTLFISNLPGGKTEVFRYKGNSTAFGGTRKFFSSRELLGRWTELFLCNSFSRCGASTRRSRRRGQLSAWAKTSSPRNTARLFQSSWSGKGSGCWLRGPRRQELDQLEALYPESTESALGCWPRQKLRLFGIAKQVDRHRIELPSHHRELSKRRNKGHE
jgi:hypothetical protein